MGALFERRLRSAKARRWTTLPVAEPSAPPPRCSACPSDVLTGKAFFRPHSESNDIRVDAGASSLTGHAFSAMTEKRSHSSNFAILGECAGH